MQSLGTLEGDTVHREAHVQGPVSHFYKAEDIDIVCANRQHLGEEVPQQLVPAP